MNSQAQFEYRMVIAEVAEAIWQRAQVGAGERRLAEAKARNEALKAEAAALAEKAMGPTPQKGAENAPGRFRGMWRRARGLLAPTRAINPALTPS